jgi:hypothetical protein
LIFIFLLCYAIFWNTWTFHPDLSNFMWVALWKNLGKKSYVDFSVEKQQIINMEKNR